MATVLREAIGLDGRIALMEDRIRIGRKGFVPYLVDKGDKEIPLADISSMEFRNAGMTNGYIHFTLSNELKPKGSLLERARDDNTVWFKLLQQKSFEAVRQAVQERLSTSKVQAECEVGS